jgi:GNAT superfamily N-acetyltransferase
MDRAALLARFDREMRARPYVPAELCARTHLGVTSVTGHYNCIVHTSLTEATAEAAIEAHVAEFEARGQDVEWKVHAHDRPADLAQRLARRGFQPDPAETLLVLPISAAPSPASPPPELTLRQVRDTAGLNDFVAANSAGFGEPRPGVRDEFSGRLNDPTAALFVAYLAGQPVAAARMELPPERAFAGLYSASVTPAYRGQGIYRALIDVRLAAARDAGHEFAMVEALETSRPILERLGFLPLTTVQGWVWRPSAA